jgi:hypothetical protein
VIGTGPFLRDTERSAAQSPVNAGNASSSSAVAVFKLRAPDSFCCRNGCCAAAVHPTLCPLQSRRDSLGSLTPYRHNDSCTILQVRGQIEHLRVGLADGTSAARTASTARDPSGKLCTPGFFTAPATCTRSDGWTAGKALLATFAPRAVGSALRNIGGSGADERAFWIPAHKRNRAVQEVSAHRSSLWKLRHNM